MEPSRQDRDADCSEGPQADSPDWPYRDQAEGPEEDNKQVEEGQLCQLPALPAEGERLLLGQLVVLHLLLRIPSVLLGARDDSQVV